MPPRSITSAEISMSLNSPPYAPALVWNPPPIVPGMPDRNSRPATPAPAAVSATFRSSAPAPASTSSGVALISAKLRPSRTTTPAIPPSRTSRFEPTPIVVTGTSRGSAARKAAKSSASAGRNSTSAGPPTRNQVNGPIGASSVRRPRTGGNRSISPSPGIELRQLFGQRVRPIRDRPGAEAHYHVARTRLGAQERRQLLRPGKRSRAAMPVRAQPGDQPVLRRAVDRRLPGRIDIGHEHDIGIVETGAEPVEQIGEPRIAVRLHDRDHPARRDRPRRLQHSRDLDRMVAVIVDDSDPFPFAGFRKAAPYAGELAQGLAHDFVVDAQLAGDRDHGHRVLHVVLAEHRQHQVGNPAFPPAGPIGDDRVEPAAIAPEPDIGGAEIGLRAKPIGHDAAIRDARDQSLHNRMIDAQHRESVKRDVRDKNLERLMQ